MKQFKLLLPVVLLVFVACNNQESKKEENHDDHQKSEMNNEQIDNKENHEETAGKVRLDNGKKWKANPETITGINNMSTLVQNGITGKVESHNQLHNYLLPVKEQLDKLKAGSSDINTLEEMQEYLVTFKIYFE